MLKEFPRIETARLLLRPWEPGDLLPFSALNADARVMEFFPQTLSPEASKTMFEGLQERFEENGFGFWATELKGSHEFIGFIGLNIPKYRTPFSPFVEVGWRLGYEHWGNGYATEGARASLEFGFSKLGLKEIVSFTAVQNSRSQKVMEKIGMNRDPGGTSIIPLWLRITG